MRLLTNNPPQHNQQLLNLTHATWGPYQLRVPYPERPCPLTTPMQEAVGVMKILGCAPLRRSVDDEEADKALAATGSL